MLRDKGLLFGIIATVILVVGGVFYFTGNNSSQSKADTAINNEILAPADSFKTSGLQNNEYLPASDSAKVTIVEFGDYQCPACSLYHPLIKQLITDYSGRINYIYRNFPLAQHSNAEISAQAAISAGNQNKFWQMHDKIYETQKDWEKSADAKNIFVNYAKDLGLDIDKFKADIESAKTKDRVKKDYNDGVLVKINATPSFFINGVKLDPLPSNYDSLKSVLDKYLSN